MTAIPAQHENGIGNFSLQIVGLSSVCPPVAPVLALPQPGLVRLELSFCSQAATAKILVRSGLFPSLPAAHLPLCSLYEGIRPAE